MPLPLLPVLILLSCPVMVVSLINTCFAAHKSSVFPLVRKKEWGIPGFADMKYFGIKKLLK